MTQAMSNSVNSLRISTDFDLRAFLSLQGVDSGPIFVTAQRRAEAGEDYEQALIDELEPHRVAAWKAQKKDPGPRPEKIWETE